MRKSSKSKFDATHISKGLLQEDEKEKNEDDYMGSLAVDKASRIRMG